jgi:magnesium transporter
VRSQGQSWFPLPRRVPARRGGREGGATTTVPAPPAPPLSEEEIRSAVVDCGLYQGGERIGGHVELADALKKADACEDGFVWIGLHDPSPGVVEAVGEHFELHPLAVEDAVHGHERAKLEVYGGDTLFVVLKTARYVDSQELIEIGEVMVFLGERFVVTVRHGEGSPLHDVRLDLEAHPDLLSIGPSSVLYAIADRIVDDYVAVIDGIAVDVEEVEVEVFSGAGANPAERIYRLKREVLQFRRAVSALIGRCRGCRPSRPACRSTRGRASTSATSTTTSCATSSASPASTSCSATRCRPTSPRSRCATTRTCAASRRGWRSSPSRQWSSACTA